MDSKNSLVDLTKYYGRMELLGEDCIDLLDRLSTNDVSVLRHPGQGLSSVLTTNKGRIIDLLGLFLFEDKFLLVSSSDSIRRVSEWIEFYTIMEDVEVKDISHTTFHFRSIDNPQLQNTLGLGEANFGETVSEKVGNILCSAMKSQMGGLSAIDIVGPVDDKEYVLSQLKEKSETISLSEFEELRIKLGVPAYGKELSEDYNPIEAGLLDHISFNKGCYIGQEVVARLNAYDKVQRKLVRLTWSGDIDSKELTVDGKVIGKIKSAGYGQGLGYVRNAYSENGQIVQSSKNDVTVIPTN